jgi:hypothetical protein
MVGAADWSDTCSGIAYGLTDSFVTYVFDNELVEHVKAVRLLKQPLSIFIHHLERPGTRASWLIPLYEALLQDLSVWKENPQVTHCFGTVVQSDVINKFNICYHGAGSKKPIYEGEWFMQCIWHSHCLLSDSFLLYFQECIY